MTARWIVTLKNAPPLAVTATAVAKTHDDDFLQFSDGDGGRLIVALVPIREIVSLVCRDEEPATPSDDLSGQFTLRNGVLWFKPLTISRHEAIFDLRNATRTTCANITKEQARRIAAALDRWATS